MQCLTPDCGSDKLYSRGLCKDCYRRLAARVRRGTVTWADLVEQGLAKRSVNRGAPPQVRSEVQIKSKIEKSKFARVMMSSERQIIKTYLDRGYVFPGEPLTEDQIEAYKQLLGESK